MSLLLSVLLAALPAAAAERRLPTVTLPTAPSVAGAVPTTAVPLPAMPAALPAAPDAAAAGDFRHVAEMSAQAAAGPAAAQTAPGAPGRAAVDGPKAPRVAVIGA